MHTHTHRTYVLLIVDESTSMLGVAKGVRVGVNSYLADLTDQAAAQSRYDFRLTLVTFGEKRAEPLCVAVDVAHAPRLSCNNYQPNGNTALLDAIGLTLQEFAEKVPVLDPGDRVMCIVASDGAENYSKRFAADTIAAMVRDREATGQWTFFHLAAGPDAAVQSPSLGLRHVIAIAQYDLAREALYDNIGRATKAFADGSDTSDITAILNAGTVDAGLR